MSPSSLSANRMQSRLDRWIFDSYTATPEGLGLYRIAYALFAFLFIAPGHATGASFPSLADLPDVFFLPPPGPMQLLSGFPPAAFFDILHGLIALSLAALLFGFHTRIASVGTTVFLLIGFGFSYSLGKINHNILFVLLPLVMTPSNWGAAYSFDAHAGRTSRSVRSWPIVLLMLITGFAMFTAGFPKILGGWLDPSTQATQGHFVRQYFVHGRQDLLAPLAATLHAPWVWEFFDVATVVFEVGFLFAILHPASTRLFAVLAVAFHTGVKLTLNIAFLPNLIVYAAVLPWPRIARWVESRIPSLPAIAESALVRWIAVGGIALLFYGFGSPVHAVNDWLPFTSDLTAADVLGIALSWVVIAVVGATGMSGNQPRRRRPA